ncbi:MAG: D-sedoheptulose-7-phosphate isomerase [Acidimicrobiales bacterium]
MTKEATDFLYPFIEHDERDATSLLVDLARSARGKWDQSDALRERTLARSRGELAATVTAMAHCFAAGGQLFSCGNGGSATDADAVAQLFTKPPWGTPLPARSLASDHSVLTALANDIGFDVVFSRQLIAHARANDIALGLSTSGNSENLLAAFAEAKRRGMLTVGLAGYDGGQMATCGHLDHCLVARSDSVHRIQETQAALYHVLWAAVQTELPDRRSV